MIDFTLSRYNFYHPENGNLRVLNALSRAVVEFPDTDQANLRRHITTLPRELTDYLWEQRFIVAPECDEYQLFLEQFYTNCACDDTFTATIGFTFKCNFRCDYCIQKDNYLTRASLSRREADAIIDWIAGAVSTNTRRININYFGGEPTLNMEVVTYFAERLNAWCATRSIDTYYQMVTNGYALSDTSIDRLLERGIGDYQITLDGLRETHNARRSRTFDSFSRIVDNIIALSNRNATVNLLHVFDTSNVETTMDLIDYFVELAETHPSLRRNLVFNFSPTIPKAANEATCNRHVVGQEVFLSEKGVEAFAEAARKGFRYVNFLNVDRCFRQVRHSVLIAPDLSLYKCYSTFGDRQYAVCDLTTPYAEYLRRSAGYARANGLAPRCVTCDVAPICRGGCQFAASEQHGGDYGHPYCEKEIIDAYIRGFLANALY